MRLLFRPDDYPPQLSFEWRKKLASSDNIALGVIIGGLLGLAVVTWVVFFP